MLIKHIFREANEVADQLTSKGCELEVFGYLMRYPSPPVFVIPLFDRDKIDITLPRLVSSVMTLNYVSWFSSAYTIQMYIIHRHKLRQHTWYPTLA